MVERNNDQERWKAYITGPVVLASPPWSTWCPSKCSQRKTNSAHGISAVKAIQIAAAEGQKIWTITQSNLSTSLAAINLPSAVESDIRNSVYAGMEVTAHEAAINFYGSSQVGYIVIDPETGSGGYLIGGGENGGDILTAVGGLLGWLSGITSVASNGKPIFDGKYSSIYKAARSIAILGVLALVVESVGVLSDSSLSWSSKLGRLAGAMFAFASTAIVVSSAFIFAGPVFAAIVGMIFSITLSLLLSSFYNRYFAFNQGVREQKTRRTINDFAHFFIA